MWKCVYGAVGLVYIRTSDSNEFTINVTTTNSLNRRINVLWVHSVCFKGIIHHTKWSKQTIHIFVAVHTQVRCHRQYRNMHAAQRHCYSQPSSSTLMYRFCSYCDFFLKYVFLYLFSFLSLSPGVFSFIFCVASECACVCICAINTPSIYFVLQSFCTLPYCTHILQYYIGKVVANTRAE